MSWLYISTVVGLLAAPPHSMAPVDERSSPQVPPSTRPELSSVRYAILRAPTLGGEQTTLRAINDNGIAAGASFPHPYSFSPIIYDLNGALSPLEVPPGMTHAECRAINVDATCAGDSLQSVLPWATRWQKDGSAELLSLDGGDIGTAQGINALNEVVGDISREYRVAYLWLEDGTPVRVGTLGGNFSYAFAINDLGQIVGLAETEEVRTGFLWQDHRMVELPPIDGVPDGVTRGNDINNLGLAVGISRPTVTSPGRAAMWEIDVDGTIQATFDLHPTINPPGDSSHALKISDSGVILGTVFSLNRLEDVWHVWPSPADEPIPLRMLLPPLSTWELDAPEDVNSLGQVCGFGRASGRGNDPDDGFVLTPVSPSFTITALGPLRAGRVNEVLANGLTPGARAYLVWSRKGGGTMIPGCTILENVLQVENAQLASIATADANGEATFRGFVPQIAQGQQIVLQAVVVDECAISDLVVTTIQ